MGLPPVLALALISLQQLQYDSLIHLLPFLVVIAIKSIGNWHWRNLLSPVGKEGGLVESKKRNVLACFLTLILNKAFSRSWSGL